jgi:hypothetical protein
LNEITYPDVCHKSLTRDGHREVGVEKQHDETPPTNDEPYLAAMEFPTLDRAGSSQKSALFENMKVQDDPRAEGRTHARSPDSRLSETGQSSPDKPSTTRETSSQSDAYREWYEGPSSTPAFTPPPSSFGSSASATAPAIGPFMPYPMPHPGYYPTHGWVQPLPQHFSYPMPYMPGFPGFAAPAGHVAPSFASTTGSDSSGPAPVTQNTWSGLYTVRPNVRMYESN